MDLVRRLSYLFGTSEDVKRRRHLVLIREKILTSFNNTCNIGHVIICSGSLGEGVAYPRSDDDLMLVNTEQYNLVYDRYKEAIDHRAQYLVPSEYSPGFCFIQDTRQLATGVVVVSSKLYRDNFLRRNPGAEQHGPCASVTLAPLEYDLASCLSCPRWPTMANEWIVRRRRYGWPSREFVENISRGGCHVVPIGNPDSPMCDLEWRVSFSLAERSLIHAFNHVQFIVYTLLKLVLKRVIGVRVPNVLCSYFLKTTLYYTIENTRPEIWVNSAIDECYRKCLLTLFHFIDTKNCPNYFVPENNMMRRKVNENNKLPLLCIVNELMTCGIVGSLRLCGEKRVLSRRLSRADIEFRCDIELLTGYHLLALICDYDVFILQQFGKNAYDIATRNVLSPLLSTYENVARDSDASFITLIIKRLFTLMGLQCINASLEGTKMNSSRYQMLKSGQAMLNIGCKANVSFGKLHLANYMFMIGRFSQSLAIIQSVLSNIMPYVIYRGQRDAVQAQRIYKEIISNNGHSTEYKMRKAWAFGPIFTPDIVKFGSLPDKIVSVQTIKRLAPMRDGRAMSEHHFLVFAYYIQGVCFYQTHDFESMNNSVTLLEDTMKYLTRDELYQIFLSRLLLSYMRMLQQDYNSSCRCLTSAYLMKEQLNEMYKIDSSDRVQTSLILLACLLNRIARTK